MRKVIGIVGWSTGEASFGVSKPYLQHLMYYGDVVILTPNMFLPNLDLLVLPGGKDVVGGGQGDFSYYNSDGERFLEHFDKFTLPKYIDNKTPIWGTCRGFQTLCSTFGLKIEQEMYGHPRSKDENDATAHLILVEQKYEKYFLDAHNKGKKRKIGSWHHQGVLVDEMEKEDSPLEVIGWTEDDSCVEFMRHKTLPIAGAQGHVERDWNPFATKLIKSLLKMDIQNPIDFYGEENV